MKQRCWIDCCVTLSIIEAMVHDALGRLLHCDGAAEPETLPATA